MNPQEQFVLNIRHMEAQTWTDCYRIGRYVSEKLINRSGSDTLLQKSSWQSSFHFTKSHKAHNATTARPFKLSTALKTHGVVKRRPVGQNTFFLSGRDTALTGTGGRCGCIEIILLIAEYLPAKFQKLEEENLALEKFWRVCGGWL